MKAFVPLMVLLATSCFAQTSAPPSPPLPALDQILIGNSKAVLEAQKTKDAELLGRMLSDDFQQVGSEGHFHPKSELLDDAREGELKDYTLYNFRVRTIDPNTALVHYNAILQMPEGDSGMAPRYQILSDLWVRERDTWKLRFEQATPLRSID